VDDGPAYYNENDPFAAEWLGNLKDAGLVPAGDIDTRSIKDVEPNDLDGYAQCHFFAGIGGWPLALRLAGWPDDAPVWTGSCPCQPFSDAGKKAGTDDPRHLWPDFRRLIAAGKPAIAFGEQVASKDGRRWLAGVRSEVEALGYEFGAADLCAAGIASPHIRQRLFWVADSGGTECRWWAQPGGEYGLRVHSANGCGDGGVANSTSLRRAQHEHDAGERSGGPEADPSERDGARGLADAELQRTRRGESGIEGLPRSRGNRPAIDSDADGLVNRQQSRLERHSGDGGDRDKPGRIAADQDGPVAETGTWSAFLPVPCRDERTRRIPLPESGVFPLAYGIPRNVGSVLTGVAEVGPAARAARSNRVGRLKGYGNAIVPQLAAQFIAAYIESSAL
jgi:DNA (cytosine-5)-methyltransferase 1